MASIHVEAHRPSGKRESWLHHELTHIDPLWAVSAILAAGLLLATVFVPLWRMDLNAPQYPQGLTLTAYGTGMEGQLTEINELNHYIGVKPIDPGAVLEFKLFPFMIAAIVVGLLVSALTRDRRVHLGLMALLWALPVGFLVDLQWWLYRFGHDLDSTAPFRFGEFTPKVLGATKVMNFDSNTMVAGGFFLFVAAALLVTVGPAVVRFVLRSWQNTGASKTTASAAGGRG